MQDKALALLRQMKDAANLVGGIDGTQRHIVVAVELNEPCRDSGVVRYSLTITWDASGCKWAFG